MNYSVNYHGVAESTANSSAFEMGSQKHCKKQHFGNVGCKLAQIPLFLKRRDITSSKNTVRHSMFALSETEITKNYTVVL